MDLDSLYSQLITWRRHFHRHPEMGLEEFETRKYILQQLDEWGVKYDLSFSETGIVVIMEGNEPGVILGFRADMDALPLVEENKVDYRSKATGCMHACGHDAHLAILLGLIKIIHSLKNNFKGKVIAIFQPGEEGQFGAKKMLDAGLLGSYPLDKIFGLHVWNFMDIGKIGINDSAMMAAADEFFIDIIGKGGHAAYPEDTVDPILISAKVIDSIQSIVSRNISPTQSGVVTIGKIEGGTAFNIIPDKVRLEGTLRAFNQEQREYMKFRLEEILKHTVMAYGADYTLDYVDGYPPVINSESEYCKVKSASERIVGEENIIQNAVSMGGEDFSYFLNEVPGAFLFIGSKNDSKNLNYPHHHPKFDFDENALLNGLEVFVELFKEYQ